MKKQTSGFTAVEVLVTIIVAAIFLLAFYQLYVSVNYVNARTAWLAKANQIVYAKLQTYESKNFDELEARPWQNQGRGEVCSSSTKLEDFSSEFTNKVPGPTTAYVCIFQMTPTLKYLFVTASFGKDNEKLQYNSYIQESRVD